jgi:hypothetical protein
MKLHAEYELFYRRQKALGDNLATMPINQTNGWIRMESIKTFDKGTFRAPLVLGGGMADTRRRPSKGLGAMVGQPVSGTIKMVECRADLPWRGLRGLAPARNHLNPMKTQCLGPVSGPLPCLNS